MQWNRHPSEFFIKYLLTLPRKEAQDNNWIQLGIENIGYPAPEDSYLDELRQELYKDLPVDYNPTDRYHRPSVKFLRNAGIWSLHNPDEAVREATAILVNYRARKIIEQLLLGRIDPKEVALKANGRLNTYFTTGTIKAFNHYYWNTHLLQAKDWVYFFKDYESVEREQNISVLHGGPSMALHMTGFQQNLESKEMLRYVQEGLFFEFKRWEKQPLSAHKAKAMASLTQSMTKVDNRLSEADSALRDSLKAFEAFRMQHAETEVKGIDEIAPHGNFTDSGADVKELPAPKDKAGSEG